MNIKAFKKFSLSTKLAFRVTIISLLTMVFVLIIILSVQYFFVRSKWLDEFLETSRLYMETLKKSNILHKMNFIESTGVYFPFDENGNTIGDSLVIDTDNNQVLVNEKVFLDENEAQKLLEFPQNKWIITVLDGNIYFAYRQDFSNLAIIRIGLFSSFSLYYSGIIDNAILLLIVAVFVFYGVSYYFSRLTIRPMQEYSKSLERYNNNLAHEIKTPLAVISSNLEMLELTKDPKFIKSSQEELQHIERVVNSLLFLASPKKNHREFIESNIVPIIYRISQEYSWLSIKIRGGENVISQKIDVNLFISFIKNILDNAKKYSKDASVYITLTKNYLLFENAIDRTFSQKEIGKISEMFFQMDSSRYSEGYGIGIPIMMAIADIFDWEVIIESKNNTFIVRVVLW